MQTCETTNQTATKQSFKDWLRISINYRNTYWISWINWSTWKKWANRFARNPSFSQRCAIYLIFQLLILVTSFVGLCCIFSEREREREKERERETESLNKVWHVSWKSSMKVSHGSCWESWCRADGIFRLRTSFWADTWLCPTVSKEVQSAGVQKFRRG